MKGISVIGISLVIAVSVAACGGEVAVEAPEAEVPTLDVTAWTDTTELFMEFAPLVAGQEVLFAVHLTRLSDFSAMTTGRPRIEFTAESGGSPAVLQGEEASRPGVLPGARRPAGFRPLQLGARHRRAGSDGPSRPSVP